MSNPIRKVKQKAVLLEHEVTYMPEPNLHVTRDLSTNNDLQISRYIPSEFMLRSCATSDFETSIGRVTRH